MKAADRQTGRMEFKGFRGLLPLLVFSLIFTSHYVLNGIFPEKEPAQSAWLTFPEKVSWWQSYIDSQNYFLGFSYALSSAFAAITMRRYLKERSCAVGKVAAGSMAFSGSLAVFGCFLIGCCGSPMLAVYLNLFGASILPIAKPILAAFTAVSIGIAWWRMNKGVPYNRKTISSSENDPCKCGD